MKTLMFLFLIFIAQYSFGTQVQCWTDGSGTACSSNEIPLANIINTDIATSSPKSSLVINSPSGSTVYVDTLENTKPLQTYMYISNSGIPFNLNIDSKAKWNPNANTYGLTYAPNASPVIVVADTIGNVNVDVSGYVGIRGDNASEICAKKILASDYGVTQLNLFKSRCNDGTTANPCANNKIRTACDSTDITNLNSESPIFGTNTCPANYTYLNTQDSSSTPFTTALKKVPASLNKCDRETVYAYKRCRQDSFDIRSYSTLISGPTSGDLSASNFGAATTAPNMYNLQWGWPNTMTWGGSWTTSGLTATYKTPPTHTISWDGKDRNGNWDFNIKTAYPLSSTWTFWTWKTADAGCTCWKNVHQVSTPFYNNPNQNINGIVDNVTFYGGDGGENTSARSEISNHTISWYNEKPEVACAAGYGENGIVYSSTIPQSAVNSEWSNLSQTITWNPNKVSVYANSSVYINTNESCASIPSDVPGQTSPYQYVGLSSTHGLITDYTSLASGLVVNPLVSQSVLCTQTSCPGVTISSSTSSSAGEVLSLGDGEKGSSGSRATIVAYDIIGSETYTYANGTNSENGVDDMVLNPVLKNCVNIVDNDTYYTQVQFHSTYWKLFTFNLSSVNFNNVQPSVTQDEAILIYKKVSPGIRELIKESTCPTCP